MTFARINDILLHYRLDGLVDAPALVFVNSLGTDARISRRPFMADTEMFDRGMEVRRSVLGDAHVDRATAATIPFDQDFQAFITEGAWARSRPVRA